MMAQLKEFLTFRRNMGGLFTAQTVAATLPNHTCMHEKVKLVGLKAANIELAPAPQPPSSQPPSRPPAL